jgi:hypothetical protein
MPPEVSVSEYVYGPAPVVLAKIDFEYYMFREIYEPLMPEAAKAARDGVGPSPVFDMGGGGMEMKMMQDF